MPGAFFWNRRSDDRPVAVTWARSCRQQHWVLLHWADTDQARCCSFNRRGRRNRVNLRVIDQIVVRRPNRIRRKDWYEQIGDCSPAPAQPANQGSRPCIVSTVNQSRLTVHPKASIHSAYASERFIVEY